MAPDPRRDVADAGIATIVRTIRNRTGLAFPAGRASASTLARAIAESGAPDVESYAERLADDTVEFDALIAELTVGETYFLRETAQLDFVAREIFPALAQGNREGKTLTAWSAGCSTGEEAYSLAILAGQNAMARTLGIIGTDVARGRLNVARKGLYGKWSLRGVPDEVVAQHFRRVGSLYSVSPSLRLAVTFRYLNLRASDWSTAGIRRGSMDLILCRNVLIYLDAETIARVASGLMDALTPGGWLLLGASDPPLADLVPCEVVITGSGIAYRPARRSRGFTVRADTAHAIHQVESKPERISPVGIPYVRPSCVVAPAARTKKSASEKDLRQTVSGVKDLYQQMKYEEACALARDLVSEKPDLLDAWVVLVRGLSNLGRLSEATFACEAALEVHRTSAELAYMHAVLFQADSQLDEAAASLRRALYLDPHMAVAHIVMGDIAASQGSTETALRAYQNAERVLAAHAPDAVMHASDGQTAGYLRGIANVKRALLSVRHARS